MTEAFHLPEVPVRLKHDKSNRFLTELFSPFFKVKSDGTLYFEKVISEDEGRYTCKVTNGFGRPIEASAHIAVEYAARVSFTPTTQGRYSVMSCEKTPNHYYMYRVTE